MAKKTKKRRPNQNAAKNISPQIQEKVEFDEGTEQLFKRILRIMSWIVGICFVLIIILPQFNSSTLDSLTQLLYYIGIVNLLLFTLIEMIADSVKKMLQKITGQRLNET
jgi:hypothetical protein